MSKWLKFAVKILCGSIKLARPTQPAAEEAQSLFRNLVHKTREGLAKSEEKRSYAEAELIFTC